METVIVLPKLELLFLSVERWYLLSGNCVVNETLNYVYPAVNLWQDESCWGVAGVAAKSPVWRQISANLHPPLPYLRKLDQWE